MTEANKFKIKPLGDRVVLEPMAEEQKTKSGIVLPDTVDKEKPEQAKVVAVGPGRWEDGKIVPMGIKKGDLVLFTKYGPNEVKIDGKEYLIAEEKDILAILE
ncbi:MAG: co-chaperone GroES [Candidatus Terrybacteria bacterium RIFCSPLOWO2_01_FULL_44_24]|uniref:Co-chaperonin GroES n=1 Tax=Candidatus Terrybacteria bacterium RIFCSPHIGHO2_01_FULL_43_35 TaxID=1802361 RepID=A0A1G2PHU8_9BACT|nr:MAG: co-chaperone GroES [Candidatus Terrybacteria bacterium RIFCSPHIGHO2_01_FULL_43_35]OHA50444.1 MAG: co-chaperone GroES [Candidatus Terrybacteria bacterium RIFCSPHIGHO2_02_FULL_43_14]OHA51099.1 MAG: co-chaperone GroES [Candidatus Terrybacteria bacterium RIFCSPLOWO2_01_FULL_44_24]